MKVYILTSGPHYEGARIERVFTTEARAIEEGLKIDDKLSPLPWVAHDSLPNFWETNMDWMQVQEKELES